MAINKIFSSVITPLTQNACDLTSASFGKGKIPPYIYHITSAKNYQSILKDGFVKTSPDELFGSGVFTFEIKNFMKFWKKTLFNRVSLQDSLLKRVSHGDNEIVLLRIPTENLNQDKLKIRSQKLLANFYGSKKLVKMVDESFDELLSTKNISEERKIYEKYMRKCKPKRVVNHLCHGLSSKFAKLYSQIAPIEYIYKDNIPVQLTQKVGEVKLNEALPTIDVFGKLFHDVV